MRNNYIYNYNAEVPIIHQVKTLHETNLHYVISTEDPSQGRLHQHVPNLHSGRQVSVSADLKVLSELPRMWGRFFTGDISLAVER